MAKHRHEEHEEHMDESWLVPYADVLTLLLALFIVLFATSKVDQAKVQQIAESFRTAFNSGAGIFESGNAPIMMPATVNPPSSGQSEAQQNEASQLSNLQEAMDRYITDNDLSHFIHTRLTQEGLVLEIRDTLFFDSGSASLLPSSYKVADAIGRAIAAIDQQIVISGHTDDTPISTPQFPSNWELSSARAISFMKYLLNTNSRLLPQRFSAVGYAQYRPIAANTTKEGRDRNRRIEVMIVRSYPISTK